MADVRQTSTFKDIFGCSREEYMSELETRIDPRNTLAINGARIWDQKTGFWVNRMKASNSTYHANGGSDGS